MQRGKESLRDRRHDGRDGNKRVGSPRAEGLGQRPAVAGGWLGPGPEYVGPGIVADCPGTEGASPVLGQRDGAEQGCQVSPETPAPQFPHTAQPGPHHPVQQCSSWALGLGLPPELPSPRAFRLPQTLGNNGGIVGGPARCRALGPPPPPAAHPLLPQSKHMAPLGQASVAADTQRSTHSVPLVRHALSFWVTSVVHREGLQCWPHGPLLKTENCTDQVTGGQEEAGGDGALLWDSQVEGTGGWHQPARPPALWGVGPAPCLVARLPHAPHCKGPSRLCPDGGCLHGVGTGLGPGAVCPLGRSSCPREGASLYMQRGVGSYRLTCFDWGRMLENQVQALRSVKAGC